jgi:hypothetical protein
MNMCGTSATVPGTSDEGGVNTEVTNPKEVAFQRWETHTIMNIIYIIIK